jgi:hypothetical protein
VTTPDLLLKAKQLIKDGQTGLAAAMLGLALMVAYGP